MINSILDSFGIKESWRGLTLTVWIQLIVLIILFVYELDLDPNEHIFDWIKFIMASSVFIIPFTVVYLFIVAVIQDILFRKR